MNLLNCSKRIPQLLILIFCINVHAETEYDKLDNHHLVNKLNQVRQEDKNSVLQELWELDILKSPEDAMKWATKMLRNSKQYGNRVYEQMAYQNIAESHRKLGSYDSAMVYVNKALELNEVVSLNRTRGRIYLTRGFIYEKKGNMDDVYTNFHLSLNVFKNLNDSLGLSRIDRAFSFYYRAIGKLDLAMEHSIKALEFYENKQDSFRMAAAWGDIQDVHKLNFNYKKQKQGFLKMLELLKNYKQSSLYGELLRGLSLVYVMEKKLDTAMLYADEYYDRVKRKNNKHSMALALNSKGNISMYNNDDKTAIKYFKEAKELYKQIKAYKYVAVQNSQIGEAHYAMYRYDSALVYLNKAMEQAKAANYYMIIDNVYKVLENTYTESKNYKKALDIVKESNSYRDSIRSAKVQSTIAELETKYETEKKEHEICSLQQQQKVAEGRQRFLVLIFTSVGIILLMIIMIIYVRRKKDRQLAQAELEKTKLKEKELHQSNVYKTKQLSTHALHMMQKNKLLQDIQEEIDKVTKVTTSNTDGIRRVKLLLSQSLRSDKEWDAFKNYFEEVNQGFYKNLHKINPALTTTDQKMCALIKLNMDSKEMASVLNVVPNSIKSSRYRLKKKLGLGAENDLEEFIKTLN